MTGQRATWPLRAAARWGAHGVAFIALLLSGVFQPATAGEAPGAVAFGGRLYDNWYQELRHKPPQTVHPSYPASGKYASQPAETWRCSECHGWDYKGKDGLYGKNNEHHTGIKGIRGMLGADPAKIIAVLKAPSHKYDEILYDDQLDAIAAFVTRGQVNMDEYIDAKTGNSLGDKGKQERFYLTVCSNCHGTDGMETGDLPSLGLLAKNSPYEALHKILVGHPKAKMPSAGAFGRDFVADLLANLQALPWRADRQVKPPRHILASIARGGRLYDNWVLEGNKRPPTAPNPNYPAGAKPVSAETTWRCVQCHGWDYMGREGATGATASGIQTLIGAPVAKIISVLNDDKHRYGDLLSADDQTDLANFVSAGQIDMGRYIDRKTAAVKGDAARYKTLYDSVCATCHGFDGRKITTSPPLGQTTRAIPWSALHKVVNGHPDEVMPPMRSLSLDMSADIVAYMLTLPKD
ncbi:MAG: cytochrome c [Alphaproteobacteria bacterium]